VTDGSDGTTFTAEIQQLNLFFSAACFDVQLPSDCNQDGKLNISDVLCGVNLLFPGFHLLSRTPQAPPCTTGEGNLALLDSNGDSKLDVSDIVYMANFLFLGGRPPTLGVACYGLDKDLGCDMNTSCQ
jgi:hypothetical protein